MFWPFRYRLIALFLAMTTAAFSPALAADALALSLPQLLGEAHRLNPEILSAQKRWESVSAKIPMAKGLPAPKIGVEWEEIPRGSFKFNKATIMYQLIQSLPFPGKLSLRQEVAVKEAQQAGMMLKKTEWEVLRHVKSTYYDLYLLDRELEIEREKLLFLEAASAAAQGRYATGKASQAELLRVQGELLEASNKVAVLTHRRLATAAHMNHLLSRPGDFSVGEPGPIALVPVPASIEELLADAFTHQPELLVFKFSAERSEAAWKLSKRELLPDLETMLELRDPAMGPIGPWDLSLALVLPFWFWTKQQYGVKVALYDKESAEAAYRFMKNEITARIHEHWHEAQAAFETAHLYREGLIPLSRQAVQSALAAYESGQGSFMELLESLRMLNERQRSYHQELVALEQHRVLLEEAVGVPLLSEHMEEGTGENK